MQEQDPPRRKLTLAISGRSSNRNRKGVYFRLSPSTSERLRTEVIGPNYLAVDYLINLGLDALAESTALPVTIDAETIDKLGEQSPAIKRGK